MAEAILALYVVMKGFWPFVFFVIGGIVLLLTIGWLSVMIVGLLGTIGVLGLFNGMFHKRRKPNHRKGKPVPKHRAGDSGTELHGDSSTVQAAKRYRHVKEA